MLELSYRFQTFRDIPLAVKYPLKALYNQYQKVCIFILSITKHNMIPRKINSDIILYSVIFVATLYLSILLIIWFLELRIYECCHSCFTTNSTFSFKKLIRKYMYNIIIIMRYTITAKPLNFSHPKKNKK